MSTIHRIASRLAPSAAPSPRRRGFALIGLLAGLACSAGCVEADTGSDVDEVAQAGDEAPVGIVPRAPEAYRKAPISAEQLGTAYKNRIAVKLREGSGIRPRAGELSVISDAVRGADPTPEIPGILRVVGAARRHAFVPIHDAVTEAELEDMKVEGEIATGRELPDLNLWTYLYVDVGSDEALVEIINGLNALELVEVAEPCRVGVNATITRGEDGVERGPAPPVDARAPWPTAEELLPVAERASFAGRDRMPAARPARLASRQAAGGQGAPEVLAASDRMDPPGRGTGLVADLGGGAGALVDALAGEGAPSAMIGAPPPSAVGNYGANQRYKQAAPTGIDTDYLQASYWNSDGINWGYTDIEYAWNQNHADLGAIASSSVLVNGSPAATSLSNRNHGTAVVGQLSSSADGVGTTGMVPSAAVRLSTAQTSSGYNLPGAISAAQSQFFAGAVILIEQQYWASFDCNGDNVLNTNDQDAVADDLVPVEDSSAARDAIKTATANGRIVVEAAGNGSCDLDIASFNGRFNTSAAQDSGAIIVGAAEQSTRDRATFSNFGARVDVQSEGDWQIYTTGYGGLYSAEGENKFYTSSFAGTSGASPIVTGAAVALSSILWFYNGSYYNPREMREILRRDGTPQGTGRTGHVGPRPDMRKQISHMIGRHLQIESADFDGDNRADYTVWRPSNGTWYIWFSSNNTSAAIQWGTLGDIPVAADVSGDGRAELIVWRPSNGTWYIRSWDGSSRAVQWGTLGDTPVPMDFDGDGKAQLAVVRPGAVGGTTWTRWYILSQDESWYTWADWGEFGDCPIAADFDKDGRADLAQFRGTTGNWYIAYAKGGGTTVQWGAWGDVPLTYKSSTGTNIAVFRPGSSTFHMRDLTTGATSSMQWGDYGDIPRFADTDGNGVDEVIVYRPRDGGWWNQGRWHVAYWGEVGDVPVGR